MKRDYVDVRDSRRSLVMFNLVLLLIQFFGPKKVVDRLVILRYPNQRRYPRTTRLHLQSPRIGPPSCTPILSFS